MAGITSKHALEQKDSNGWLLQANTNELSGDNEENSWDKEGFPPGENDDKDGGEEELQSPVQKNEEIVLNEGNGSGPRGRARWDTKMDFMLSVIGFAVDLGNVWRFPYLCYENGGGAFLIPYAIMAVFGGIPLLYLELALGQYQRTGCITVWKRICPLLTGIGFAICIVNMYLSFYYNTIIAWAVYYLFSSFRSELPWTSCNNTWNTPNCADPFDVNRTMGKNSVSPTSEFYERKVLESHKSTGIGDLGGVKWDLALCLFAVYLIVFLSLWRGIKASGKVVWVTATLPYICLIVLLIRGVTLEGAIDGIIFYLDPKWELLLNPGVWMGAATQVFFSLGPGFGVMLAFSSYNNFHNNCYSDALIVGAINCWTSFVSGFAVFSALGYMALKQGTTVEEVAKNGIGLVFTVYPEALATMPAPGVLSVICFIMLITLGLDSTFGGLESIITAWSDKFPTTIGKHRGAFVALVVSCCFLGSLSTVTYGGQHVIRLYDTYAVGVTVLAIVLLEVTAVSWCYGLRAMSNDIKAMLGFKPNCFWLVCWKFLSPAAIIFIVIFGLLHFEPIPNSPQWADYLGWTLMASSIMCVPLCAVNVIASTPGTFIERIKGSFKPQEKPDTEDSEVTPITYV
ncbi:sodium-dependent serotonin transporter-like [Asterias amurensis]|uniref:sodium-dependent serotonin transporter-like n=1 Tax=Asterias amurensis TaxID=7602 RepID=UPI003AB47A9C